MLSPLHAEMLFQMCCRDTPLGPWGSPLGCIPSTFPGRSWEPSAATDEGPPPPQPSSLQGCTGQSQPGRRGAPPVCASGCWGSWEGAGCTDKRSLLWVSCTPSCYNINCCALPGLDFPLTTKRQDPLSVSNTSEIPQPGSTRFRLASCPAARAFRV